MKAPASFLLTRSPAHAFLCIALFLLLACPAFAAPVHVPNIGQALQEAETARPRQAPTRQAAPEIVRQEEVPMILPSGETLFVREFALLGAECIDPAELQAVLAPYRNLYLTLAQIEEDADRVTSEYR